MYLKSIEVQGFKSFANKIVFDFHNGITGIVGPNGSGKSNVADAVRWVLGEQRAKQLRGASMQDVIFSGTENRKAQGFASVAITLDNSDHQLPIEFEEVTVARRVFRSGESEYLINGSACRLKDVNELFYDTGIGKEGYSIIGQGQIDKILSGRPEERRELFDEAVGIVKFKRRKATAQKKLEDEKANLVRVNDILSEIEKQLAPLERQSETAKEYLKKKDELKIYDVNMFLMESERINTQLASINEKLKIAEEDLKTSSANYESTKEEYEKLEKDIEELDARIDETKGRLGQESLVKGQLEGQVNVLNEQINTAKSSDEYYNRRRAAINEEVKERREQKNAFESEKAEIDGLISGMDGRQLEAKNILSVIQERISSLNADIETGKNDIFEVLNSRASTKAKLQRYDTMLEQINIRKAELSQKLIKMKSDEAEQDAVEEGYTTELETVEKTIASLRESQKARELAVTEIQENLVRQNERLNTLQPEYHREKSRLDSLKNITERYDGYGNSIRKVMECKDSQKGIVGVVADIIKVEKEYEVAIETALGGSIQNIVTDNENTAKGMIEYLKKNKFGRATFLPLTSIGNKGGFSGEKALSETGVIGIASELVKTEPKYQDLARYLLGRTLVVDNIDNAIAIARKFSYSIRIVTLEGESLSPGGSMTGGAFKNASNLLGRRREIEELDGKVAELYQAVADLQSDIAKARDQRNNLRAEISENAKSLQEQFILQNTGRMNVKKAIEKKNEIRKSYNDVIAESREIERQVMEIGEGKQAIDAELHDSETKEKQIERNIRELQEELDGERTKEASVSRQTSDIAMEFAGLAQKKEFLAENTKRINSEIRKLEEELVAIDQQLTESADEVKNKEVEIQKIRDTIRGSVQRHEELDRMLKSLTEEKEKLSGSHKNFFKKREELSARMNELDKECFRLGNQKEKLEESSENQINYMWEEYEITYSVAASMRNPEMDNPAAIKKQITAVKEEIRKLGDVNVNAIEDYKNMKERYGFLSTQRDDLVTAEHTLLNIIEELDAGMRSQFREKFALIRIEFDKAFKELFGGGKGSLELVEDEDVLEAGIQIISQPPGKKLQNMMQLSGGEKALTAIALLFAIQNLKPSPFCLLDEIEAALDDSNVTRFAKYLHKLTKNTQFIIITHRRGTMAAADRLYGITMQEKGVSTLVSVNLIEEDLDK